MVIEHKRGRKVEYVLYIEDKSGRVREIIHITNSN